MRQTISGLVAAIALTAASAAPAMACGYGGCAPYAPAYTTNTGCYTCGGWEYERLVDPETQYHVAEPAPQYYYVNQGPTFTGPGAFAPYPNYQDGAVSGWDAYGRRPYYHGYDRGAGVDGPRVDAYHWRHHYTFHPGRHSYRYGYVPRHPARYGYHDGRPALRRYY